MSRTTSEASGTSLAPRLGARPDEQLPAAPARKLALFRRLLATGKISGSVTLTLNFNQGQEASWSVSCDVHGRPDRRPQALDADLVRQALAPPEEPGVG